jgi:putative transposase
MPLIIYIYTIMMQTLKVKVVVEPEQAKALHETMHQFNAACNYVAEIAFQMHTANKIKLQPIVYHDIREKFGISSQMAVRAISKACEAYKQDKSIKPTFDLNGAVIYDQRILSWKGLDTVSLLTVHGRIKAPVKICDYHAPRLDRIRGQADLIFRNKEFYLCVIVEVPEPVLIVPTNVLGVDLGIKNIAVDSTGETFSGKKIDKTRAKLDNLKGIRERTTVQTKVQRHRHSSWSFDQLRQFIGYKAAIAGVPVAYIDPAYTSQECPICHHISRSNRPTRDEFCCICCGFSDPADIVAARNIAARASVNMPIVARFFAEPQAHEFICG